MRTVLISLVSVLCASTASARNLITTRAGCNQEFSGNKSVIASCTQCVSGVGRYKKNTKGAWSCAASSSGGGTIVYTPSTRADRPPEQVKPKALSAHNTYVKIPAGSFKIGASPTDPERRHDDPPQAKVTLTRPFMMRVTEVTADDWMFVMGSQPHSWTQDCGGECPAGQMAWQHIPEFMNRLSEMEGLEACYDTDDAGRVVWTRGLDCEGYRLPTEAEWEFAARGDETYDSTYGPIDEIAWTYDTGNGEPHPVGQKKPNSHGLYDMLGNNYEWVWDVFSSAPFENGMTDPIPGGLKQQSLTSEKRVMKGASYRDRNHYARFAHRHYYLVDSGGKEHGFRPVRTVD